MTSKQVRDARDAKQAARFAPVAIEITHEGSDHRLWDVRKGSFTAGMIRQYNAEQFGCVQPYQADGREYLSAPVKQLGNFATLAQAVAAIGKL